MLTYSIRASLLFIQKKDKAQNLHEYILYARITLIPILNEKQLTLPRGVNETKILSLLKKILQTFIPTN